MSIFYITNILQASVSSLRLGDFFVSLIILFVIGFVLFLVIKKLIQSSTGSSRKMNELEKRVVELEEKETDTIR